MGGFSMPESRKLHDLTIVGSFGRQVASIRKQLGKAETPEQTMLAEGGAAGIEAAMRKAGFGEIEAVRPVRELFLDARWTLGRLLAKQVRARPPGKVMSTSSTYLPNGLSRDVAMVAQRIGTLPEKEKTKAYTEARIDEILPTVSLLHDWARPWWYQANRRAKHRHIRDGAVECEEVIGPFPLIYADPPWQFKIYSEKGAERTADQHYPTLSDYEIGAFTVQGKTIPDLAADDAALFLWCTSSNINRALVVMDDWGFVFKSSATWVKFKDSKIQTGLGLVFRNAHEILLYGTRGKMPGPQRQSPSVFLAPRGKHSEKPEIVRQAIEKMYPDFDERTRLELFGRKPAKGWTVRGYEA
jgi:N6-adenosine-specific RNA methylase IME4